MAEAYINMASLDREESIETQVINKLRDFAENWKDASTGSQRYIARDIIDIIRNHDKDEDEKK